MLFSFRCFSFHHIEFFLKSKQKKDEKHSFKEEKKV